MNVIFSFDDGRSDALDAAKILHSYGLVGTFHVTTGFIDGTFNTIVFGKNRKSINIDELAQMKKLGMEISSHGDKHILDYNDFKTSLDKLNNWRLIDGSKAGFSIPNSEYDLNQLNEFLSKCGESLLYVRGGRSPKCYTFLSKINYVLYQITKLQFFYNKFNKFNLNDSSKNNLLFSVVVKKNIKPNNVLKFINKYCYTDKTLVLMFHSIVDKATNKWEYSTKKFKIICNGVSSLKNNGKIQCCTFVDLL